MGLDLPSAPNQAETPDNLLTERLQEVTVAARVPIRKPAKDWLGDLGEVVRGKGDGAVALKRGRLEGVEDTAVLGFDHLHMLDDSDNPAVRELRKAILERLPGQRRR